MQTLKKRDGRIVEFDIRKIARAMELAFVETGEMRMERKQIAEICLGYAASIEHTVDLKYKSPVDIESVQDAVEELLMQLHPSTAKAYILYRNERHTERDKNSRLMVTLEKTIMSDASESDAKRENANIDGNTPMGTMLKIGSESSKVFYKAHVLTRPMVDAHNAGLIHIHDLDFYFLTMTCCQIDLTQLFTDGFSTGHGFLREPNSIQSYAALAAIALQANQNDMHGGQSIPNFDLDMAPGVAKTFKKAYKDRFTAALEVLTNTTWQLDLVQKVLDDVYYDIGMKPSLGGDDNYYDTVACDHLAANANIPPHKCQIIIGAARLQAVRDTEKQTHQAMESFIHNLNTMHSRAGAQVPFSSINYGTDTSAEGRMVIKNILLATLEGLGKGETPIFPIQIFRLKKGVNYDEGDPNYDLFQLACECSAKRLFPNFAFQDAPFNLQYYDANDPRTWIAYMGCRTRVVANVFDETNQFVPGRGNLSFTSINLPRLAIEAMVLDKKERLPEFYRSLDDTLELVAKQLLERFEIQCKKKVRNFPFLMGQGVWLDSKGLGPDDSIGEIIKHGTLSIGFIGLAETLTALIGKHHGESEEAQQLGLDIIRRMRTFCDDKAAESKLNFTLVATPAEGLSGRFVGIDKRKYGIIKSVTDKEYYTNSFHVPVGYEISAYEKICLEAPYHALTNAGHITYIEMDGDPSQNIEAFMAVVKCMGEAGVGYGAINHPLDRDPVCGYTGVIRNECPHCERREDGSSTPFERIRRITGYLVGSTERFNDAKRAEERDRIKHLKDESQRYEAAAALAHGIYEFMDDIDPFNVDTDPDIVNGHIEYQADIIASNDPCVAGIRKSLTELVEATVDNGEQNTIARGLLKQLDSLCPENQL